MTRVFMVRHGPTHARTMIGWSDLPADLSDTDRIDRVSAYLPRAKIVSSDLQRARATADAIAAGRPRLDHVLNLREMHFGDWENLSFKTAEVSDPDRLRAFYETPGDISAPGGESWNKLRKRVDRAMDRLVAAKPEALIVVAHFGPILTQIQRATGKSAYDTFAQKIDNLSVTELEPGPRWRLVRANHHP
ncbi:MAG: histidine phosphatase family protein [Brevirhabdus sp.]